MFAISPRYFDDDFAMLSRLADDIANPLTLYRNRRPSPFGLADTRDSEVHNTDKEFRVRVDLHHFKPEEIKITSDDHRITVHAKHEEKEDRHGYVKREIVQSYKLPEDVDAKSVTSTMNAHGVLHIKAAKLALEAPKETPIAVEFKGN